MDHGGDMSPERHPQCCGGHCFSAKGDVRTVKYPGGMTMDFCRHCYDKEMDYRRNRNFSLSPEVQWEIVPWDKAPIATPEGSQR